MIAIPAFILGMAIGGWLVLFIIKDEEDTTKGD
jgi:hypothetical protein